VLIGEVEPELLKRVRGQTGDLNWDVLVEETTGEPDVEQARAAGARHGAEAVIWFETPSGGGLVVRVAEIGQNRLLSRRIEPPARGEVYGYSATVEAAALVVRSSLMSLARGKPLGEPFGTAEAATTAREKQETQETKETAAGRTQRTASLTKRSRPTMSTDSQTTAEETEADDEEPERTGYAMEDRAGAQPAPPAIEPEPIDVPREPSTARLKASIGWQVAVDGQSPVGQHALDARLALELGRFEVGILGSLGLLSARLEEDAAGFAIRVNRHAVLGGLGYALLAGEELRLSVGAAAGMAIFYRRTEVYTEQLQAEPSAGKNAWVVRGGLLGQWFPAWAGQWLGLELEAAADVVPAAPVFSLQEPDRVTDEYKLWPVQLVAVVGLVGRYGM
jgi:hypothetical protein